MINKNIEIRALSISDADRAADIYNLSLFYLSREKPITKEKIEEMIKKEQGLFIGAFIDNLLIGHLILKKDSEIKGLLDIGIVIDPKYQREGTGNTLLKKGIEISKSKGFKKIKAEILENNYISKKFFEKNNFKRIKTSSRKIVKNGKGFRLINYECNL